MRIYTSTIRNFWQKDLAGSLWAVILLLIPFVLGNYIEAWAVFVKESAYKILICLAIYRTLEETFFERRVVKVTIDEQARGVTLEYWYLGSRRTVQLAFSATSVEIARKKFFRIRSAQWVKFEDVDGRAYKIVEGRNGYSDDVVKQLVADIESMTHRKK